MMSTKAISSKVDAKAGAVERLMQAMSRRSQYSGSDKDKADTSLKTAVLHVITSMLENGKKTSDTVAADVSITMVTCMTESGYAAPDTAKEQYSWRLGSATWACGKATKNTGKARSGVPMELSLQAHSIKT